jgi:hypothetical protein
LFAKIFADQLIGARQNGELREIPRDIPNLMLQYLDELNRVYDEFEDREVQRAARLIAWECCKEEYRPGTVKRSELVALLGEDGERMISHLQNRLIIIQPVGPDHEGIRFTIDPLAEYLAGFHLISIYGDDTEKWSNFIKDVEVKGNASVGAFGFLRALRDCCLAKGRKELPITLPERIASIAGIHIPTKGVIRIGVLHSLTGHKRDQQ